MDGNNPIKGALYRVMGMVLAYILGLLLCLIIGLCVGCTSTQYVPVESIVEVHDTTVSVVREVKVDSVSRDKFVYVKEDNSTTYTVNERGDTVGRDRVTDRTTIIDSKEAVSRLKAENDSLREVAANAKEIKVPYPVEKIVEVNKPYWWQKALMWLGGISVAAIGLAIWLAIKRRKV